MSTRKPVVAFLNLPWFVVAHEPHVSPQPYLRRGIRAGSRWPFTTVAPAMPGSANAPIGHYLPAPWFLQSAAGWAQAKFPEMDVVLRDSVARYESISEFNAWWVATVPDYVVIETGSPCWDNDLRFIREMKKSQPKVKIAVFGPPAREFASKYKEEPVDAWLLGEPEKPVQRFLAGERGVIGFDLLTKEELHAAPFPMFDEDVAHYYADSNPRTVNGAHPWPELTVWGTRGCAFHCQFCSWPATMTNDDPLGQNKRVVRFYAPEWIEKFINHRVMVAARTGRPLQAVRFDGDMENAGDKHTIALCDVMRRVYLPWSMMCRADTVRKQTWDIMKKSGCFGVKIGFESASSRIVNEVVGKKLDLQKAEETCRYLRSIGMSVHSTWMTGNPTETLEERKLTLETIRRFYRENVHNSHQLSGTSVLDGTPLANATITDPNFVRDADGQRKVEGILAQTS